MTELIERHIGEVILITGALSLVTLAVTLLTVPWVIGRLPVDYFNHDHRIPVHTPNVRRAMLYALAKNLLGTLLLVLGFIMLFTPGQGLLTMLAGLLLMNFPGKYRLERAVVRQHKVLDALNWIRARRGQPPFEEPANF